MSSNVSKSTKGQLTTTRMLTQIAMLSAIAGVLMYFEVPLPAIAPTFYKLDFSEVPIMIGAFAMGPVAGVVIEFIKILIKLVLKGTTTAFVGDFANFLMGVAYVLPAALIYRLHGTKTRAHAAIGAIVGTLCTTVAACILNAFVLLPAYAAAFGMPIESFIEMGGAIHSSVTNLLGFAILIVAPFNLIKYVLVSIIVFVVYKRIRVVLKGV